MAVDIEGRGKNGLDFHIAFYLGECLATSPTQHCSILSNDKGFDPLIKHLLGRSFADRRVGSVKQGLGQSTAAAGRQTPAADQELAVRWLSGMQKTSARGSERDSWLGGHGLASALEDLLASTFRERNSADARFDPLLPLTIPKTCRSDCD